jgi:hypothetical protein
VLANHHYEKRLQPIIRARTLNVAPPAAPAFRSPELPTRGRKSVKTDKLKILDILGNSECFLAIVAG